MRKSSNSKANVKHTNIAVIQDDVEASKTERFTKGFSR